MNFKVQSGRKIGKRHIGRKLRMQGMHNLDNLYPPKLVSSEKFSVIIWGTPAAEMNQYARNMHATAQDINLCIEEKSQ